MIVRRPADFDPANPRWAWRPPRRRDDDTYRKIRALCAVPEPRPRRRDSARVTSATCCVLLAALFAMVAVAGLTDGDVAVAGLSCVYVAAMVVCAFYEWSQR